jgi:hypothetical protein
MRLMNAVLLPIIRWVDLDTYPTRVQIKRLGASNTEPLDSRTYRENPESAFSITDTGRSRGAVRMVVYDPRS